MCEKRCFDKKSAISALHRHKHKKKWRKECRCYECEAPEHKGCWHLTSMEEYEEIIKIPIEELQFKDQWLKLKSPVE